jgi:hypothetical protein
MRITFTILICSLFFFCGKKSETATPNYELKLVFENQVKGVALNIGDGYTNDFGEPYTVTAFKYYISNIELTDINGQIEKINNSYFLIDQADKTSLLCAFPTKQQRYKAVSFLIGVDSTRNVSGVQTGALDPAKSMFWTWNSGYIMAKLEATSRIAATAGNRITYHIGGFKTGENTARRVTLNFGTLGNLNISTNGTAAVFITTELNKWFSGRHNLKIADQFEVMSPGTLAMKYADNYEQMFTVTAIRN